MPKSNNTHFSELKECYTRGLIAQRRQAAKTIAILDKRLEIIDPHRLEQERIYTEMRGAGE